MSVVVDPLVTADEIVRLKKEGVADIRDVLVFATGQHHPGDRVFTEADLDDMVRNFQTLSAGDNPLLSVPVGVGHEHSAAPAVGRVTKLWREPDGLHATLSDLPRRFAEALDYDVWRYPSIVVDEHPPHGCPGTGCTLRSIDAVDQPAVKRLLRMPKPQWRATHSEERRGQPTNQRVVRAKESGRYHVYSEVAVMDRAALAEQLKAMGWSDEQIAALDPLPDENFAAFVNATLAAAAGAQPAAQNADAPSREVMVADLLAAGGNQSEIEAMSDADLLAKWMQLKGSSQNAEQPVVMSELKRLYAEFKRDLAIARAERRQEQVALARRQRAENEHAVRVFCERMVAERRLLPSDVDPNSSTPNEYHAGLEAAASAGTRQFGEKTMTPFEAWQARLAAKPPIHARLFAEKLPSRGDAKMTPERRAQLLGVTPIGRAILRDEARQQAANELRGTR